MHTVKEVYMKKLTMKLVTAVCDFTSGWSEDLKEFAVCSLLVLQTAAICAVPVTIIWWLTR